MKIVVTGAGSGGHITPVLAVAHELKKLKPDLEITYIGHAGDTLADIPAQDKNIDKSYFVRAGKLRRYNGEGIKQLFDLPTVWKNLRDLVFVVIGFFQSFNLLRKIKPDVIFVKGGYVGMPIGLAAAILRIPYITHDSDAMPGLANRVISPWAKIHAVALPKDVYDYPADKTVTVGVPLSSKFHIFSKDEIYKTRRTLGLEKYEKVLLITGGGLGARNINRAVVECMPEILDRYKNLAVVHIAGRTEEMDLSKKYKDVLSDEAKGRVFVKGYITNMYQYSGVADVIITRAGATSIAEFALQAKPCIVVPNPLLAGGHQLKNAKILASKKVVKMINETNLAAEPKLLMPPLVDLLDHPKVAQQFGERLSSMAIPDSAHRLAMLLLEVADNKNSS